jgi:orotidine-5'-phosphate decarboxylase
MRRAADAASETAAREDLERPSVIAVTVLTSFDAATLGDLGITFTPEAQATLLARLASTCGLDGVVASAHEIKQVRAVVMRENFLVVTPGVRQRIVANDDQRRVMSPAEAVRAGADYVVMGRAIIDAPDPVVAAREASEEIERASTASSA